MFSTTHLGVKVIPQMFNLPESDYQAILATLKRVNYGYDAGDRRTAEYWSGGRAIAYGYDDAHQLLSATSTSRPSDTAAFAYDL